MVKTRDRGLSQSQLWDQNVTTRAVNHSPTLRRDYVRTLSSFEPGKMVPVYAVPLLREDGLRSTRVRYALDMSETADMLLNAVRVIVHTYFVPKLAFERFGGFDDLNRSYNNEAGAPNWFEMEAWNPNQNQIARQLGLHAPAGSDVNDDYQRAYNLIWNFRAKNRSSSLELRDETANNLAPAFWPASVLKHVKPTFDQAMIDGEVPLNIVSQNLPVKGIGYDRQTFTLDADTIYQSDGTTREGSVKDSTAGITFMGVKGSDGSYLPDIWAELQENDITVSLSNIDLARETAAWARIRSQYQGLDEDWMMDQLLSGVRIPEQAMKHPILMSRSETVFGMAQRYATDSGNLDKSATRGLTMLEQTLRLPRMNTGGIIMAVVEVLPEQMYERLEDSYLVASSPSELPERITDELDPEPVSIVNNSFVESDHEDPDGVFGYAPLNHQWQRNAPRIGGKFYRDQGDPWQEDRNRIWTPEVENPTLGSDFYLAENLTWPVFEDTESDPFEINAQGMFMIEGLTYFGPALREATNDYDSILARVDTDRLDPPSGSQEDDDE